MRSTALSLIITILTLHPLSLQAAVTDHPADQKLGLQKTAALQQTFNQLYPKLITSLDLRTTKSEAHLRALGFDSVEQLNSSRLNAQNRLPVYYVPLNKLRAYDGKDPWMLLEPTDSFIAPILAVNKHDRAAVISAVLVSANGDEKSEEANYRFSQLGVSLTIPFHVLTKAKETILAKDDNCDYFLISIPAINNRLLGIYRENTCDFRVIDLSWTDDHALMTPAVRYARDAFREIAKTAGIDQIYDLPTEPEIDRLLQ